MYSRAGFPRPSAKKVCGSKSVKIYLGDIRGFGPLQAGHGLRQGRWEQRGAQQALTWPGESSSRPLFEYRQNSLTCFWRAIFDTPWQTQYFGGRSTRQNPRTCLHESALEDWSRTMVYTQYQVLHRKIPQSMLLQPYISPRMYSTSETPTVAIFPCCLGVWTAVIGADDLASVQGQALGPCVYQFLRTVIESGDSSSLRHPIQPRARAD